MEENQILKVENLNISYINKDSSVKACRNVNFSLNEADSLGIVGESGSGKSTVAMGMIRLLDPKETEISGKVNFYDKDLISLSKDEFNKIRWKEIAVVFQKSMNSLSPVHRIFEQVYDIYRVHEPKATKEKVKKIFVELLNKVNLSDRVVNLYPHELSGGMLQRISIAIALLFNPKLLILDEATTALDVVTQGQILDEILKLEQTMKMTRIMITHDISVVAQSCNKVAIFYAGELMEFGFTKDVLKRPYHPYTMGLIDSFPSMKGDTEEIKSIPGFMPDLSKEHVGCIFKDRCPYKTNICEVKKPKETVVDNRRVYCHNIQEISDEK
ncbi:MAG: ABC transporter ATP-binding protein [Lagierella massiliensis]|nr:ABC transporter ATP-binding protein [Lagierella massiliensis]